MTAVSRFDFPPTPIQKLESFCGLNQVYMKRDDLIPFCFGGNKVRIARCFIEDMLNREATCMVAYGSTRSNLSRVLACMCSTLGIRCVVVSSSGDDGSRFSSYNSMMVESLGAEIVACDKSDVRSAVAKTLASLRTQGEVPYYIYGDEMGCGNEKVPVSAYATAYAEVLDWEHTSAVPLDYIFHASGTGMTQAGLLSGAYLSESKHSIVGISIARKKEIGIKQIEKFMRAYLDCENQASLPILFSDAYLHGGYGRSDILERESILKLLRCEGIPADETYVGKAFDGMLRYLKLNEIKEKNILFIHTGGTPLFFDELRSC